MTFRLAGSLLVATGLLLTACGDNGGTNAGSGAGEEPTVTAPAAGEEPTVTAPAAGEAPTNVAGDATRLWIRPDLVDCIGEAPQKCMQVAEAEDGEYLYFYDSIDGFTFTEGTGYVIDVRVEAVADPPADGSSLKYTLVEIIDET